MEFYARCLPKDGGFAKWVPVVGLFFFSIFLCVSAITGVSCCRFLRAVYFCVCRYHGKFPLLLVLTKEKGMLQIYDVITGKWLF